MKDGDYLNSDYRACCGFGHRQVFENITEQLEKAAEKVIPQKLIDSILVMLETRDILKRNINYNLAVSHAVLCSLEGLCGTDIQKG